MKGGILAAAALKEKGTPKVDVFSSARLASFATAALSAVLLCLWRHHTQTQGRARCGCPPPRPCTPYLPLTRVLACPSSLNQSVCEIVFVFEEELEFWLMFGGVDAREKHERRMRGGTATALIGSTENQKILMRTVRG